MTSTTRTLPVEHLRKAQARVARAAKRCARLDIDAPVLTASAPYTKTVKVSDDYSHSIEVIDITLDAPERIGLPGWSLLGRVDTAADGTIVIVRTPGTEDIELPTIDDAFACQHCNKSRRRNETFLVSSPEDGIRQVGRNCLRDHLGFDPSGLIYWSTFVRDLDEWADESFGSAEHIYPTEYVLRQSSRIAARLGYVSRAKAEENRWESTRSRFDAWDDAERKEAAHPSMGNRREVDAFREQYPDDEAARKLYDATVAALDELDARNEWTQNVNAIATQDSVRPRHIGIAISAVVLGLKAQEPKPETEAIESHYIGTIGDRLTAAGEVAFSRHFESDYGTRTLVKVRTDDADVTWWASSFLDIDAGEKVVIVGTVKAHEIDRYTHRQTTVLTRAHIESPMA